MPNQQEERRRTAEERNNGAKCGSREVFIYQLLKIENEDCSGLLLMSLTVILQQPLFLSLHFCDY